MKNLLRGILQIPILLLKAPFLIALFLICFFVDFLQIIGGAKYKSELFSRRFNNWFEMHY